MQRMIRAAILPIAVCLLTGCSAPRAERATPGETAKIIKAEPPPWRFFFTISPEQIEAARIAPDCRPAEEDADGHWGTSWKGLRLSIRLKKKVFTNGEPIVACLTLRNSGDKVRYFWLSTPGPARDTKVVVLRGGERLREADEAKPGETFQQRLKKVWVGKSYQEPLLPGTQRQFFRDLAEMFDLTAPGSYSAHAEQWEVVALDRLPDRPGHLRGSATNLLSGSVTFQIVGSGHSD